MKIVKEFKDDCFFQRQRPNDDEVKGDWTWGLGDDGELYCKSTDFSENERWYKYSWLSNYSPSLAEMKRILKQFGHLIVFT